MSREKQIEYNNSLVSDYLEVIRRRYNGDEHDMKEAVGYAQLLLNVLIENKVLARRYSNEPEC